MKLKITLIFCALFFQLTTAQKSSPVAGDAATLIDLLRKDYGTISTELRTETIANDMAKAVAIFNSYLTDTERKTLTDCSSMPLFSTLGSKYNTPSYPVIKQKIDAISANLTEYNNLLKIQQLKENYSDPDFEEIKNTYYESKFYLDLSSLLCLENTYKRDKKNIYLSFLLDKFINKYNTVFLFKSDTFAQVNHSSSVQKALPFLGGDLAFETLIDGLARFLAKRIKEELTINVIDKVKEYLNNPSQESYINELLVLLPTTTDYLKNFDANQVLNFIDDLKQYIEQDLNNLISNLDDLRTTPRFQKLILENPDLDFAFEAFDLISQISKTENPIEYFDILENSRNIQRWGKDTDPIKFNISNTIKLTSLLAHSMLVIDDGKQKLVSLDFMSDYGSMRDFYYLYIGFLHQQNSKYFNIKFRNDTNVIDFNLEKLMTSADPTNIDANEEKIKDVISFLKENITNISSYSEKLQKNIEQVKKSNKTNDKVFYTDVYELINTLIGFSEEITKTAENITRKGIELNFFEAKLDTVSILQKTKPYFKTATSVNQIFLDLHQKKFTTAIINALEIPSNFSNNNISLNKLLELKNDFINANNLLLLKEFLSYKSIPTNTDKKEAFKKIAEQLNYILNSSNNASLANLKQQYTTLYKTIINDKKDEFEKYLTQFKSAIENSDTAIIILKEYAKIDFNETFKAPIEAFLASKVSQLPPGIKDQIIITIEEYASLTFKSVIFNENKEKELETTTNNLLRLIPVYLPELTTNVFRVKDNNVIRLVHFISNIATSNTSEDVENALESFALPTGSSSIKEETSTYVSINSFPGILFGREISNNTIDNANFAGITAPIGLYGQFWNLNKGSLGIFVPIIDIGAPVRFRLDNNNDTGTLPDFNFKDIFSPGLYVSYGFNRSPFAINAGIQYGPKLRDIDNGNGEFTDIESYRIGIGFVIDIPLFTLYNKGIK
ncbi:hypothetical protein EV195_106101 [Tenacibaculum skagerrakense]|uniref:Outer membrane protein with beta-barrel domain n=1 Tax=Tenacibaculum skagerrakense TaxID=186571 RepID=A0A4V2SLP8_9FLAO|nr:hypothetical protein [Tenacibaculum skagerrakense]TCP24296.1 hypothetical protein EV195_106101 [Tenacibaculum skagerrakense]